MNSTPEKLYLAVLDSSRDQIGVIDGAGRVRFVNRAWRSQAAAGLHTECSSWEDCDYLHLCREAAKRGDVTALSRLRAVEAVLEGTTDRREVEYTCHHLDARRWFLMSVFPLELEESAEKLFVVSHREITERKLALDRLRSLSMTDELTGLANRRRFREMLAAEWRRGMRAEQPLSVIMVDVDRFKEFNDCLGHQAGDDCLRRVGQALQRFGRRPGDVVARYGGEEFAILLERCPAEFAEAQARRILEEVRALAIDHPGSSVAEHVTASAGVATVVPSASSSPEALVERADRALYQAKGRGRNRLSVLSGPSELEAGA